MDGILRSSERKRSSDSRSALSARLRWVMYRARKTTAAWPPTVTPRGCARPSNCRVPERVCISYSTLCVWPDSKVLRISSTNLSACSAGSTSCIRLPTSWAGLAASGASSGESTSTLRPWASRTSSTSGMACAMARSRAAVPCSARSVARRSSTSCSSRPSATVAGGKVSRKGRARGGGDAAPQRAAKQPRHAQHHRAGVKDHPWHQHHRCEHAHHADGAKKNAREHLPGARMLAPDADVEPMQKAQRQQQGNTFDQLNELGPPCLSRGKPIMGELPQFVNVKMAPEGAMDHAGGGRGRPGPPGCIR